MLEEALALWRGVPLSDFQHSDAARYESERLGELRTVAAEGLAEARLACAEHAELIGMINGLVAENPLRERPRRLLMLALYRCGRHADALAAYRDACGALDEIGLQPGPELRHLEQAILVHDPSLAPARPSGEVDEDLGRLRPGAAPATNLPSDPRPLIGRDVELDQLCEMLSDGARLVTLVGTGGVGKTRLAIAAGQLVAAAPALRVIVTSQAPLRIAAETVFALEALVPSAAAELFAERAAATERGVVLSKAGRPVVAEICERVGRLPLAIELAAARMGVLAPADLLRRLEGSSTVLRSAVRDAPERHRSLRATFEWTHGALSEAQQILFRRLGVFAGAVPVAAIEAVAEQLPGDPEPLDTLDALEALVEFSLVHRDESPVYGFRFAMPQALRDFAREKLARAALERDPELHRSLMAALGLMLVRRGRAREANEHLARALAERRAPKEPLDAWLGTIHASGLTNAGRVTEAWESLEPVIDFLRHRGDESQLALALDAAAWIYMDVDQFDAAVAAADESLELVRRAGERRLLPRALTTLTQAIIDARRLEEAERLLDEAESQADATPDAVQGIATMRADVALGRGNHPLALSLYATSLAPAERMGDSPQVVNDAVSIVSLLSIDGETEAAIEADALLVAIARDIGHDGANIARGKYRDALVAMRSAAGAAGEDAARMAAAVPAGDRVSRVLALARAAGQR